MNTEKNRKCGERLKATRKEKGLTRNELAEAANVSGQHIYNIERGARTLTLSIACACADILGVSEQYLLCETDYRTPEEELLSKRYANYENEDKLQTCLDIIMRDFLNYTLTCVLASEQQFYNTECGMSARRTEKKLYGYFKNGKHPSLKSGGAFDDYYIYDTPQGRKALAVSDVLQLRKELVLFIKMRLLALESNIRVEEGWPYRENALSYDSDYILSMLENWENNSETDSESED